MSRRFTLVFLFLVVPLLLPHGPARLFPQGVVPAKVYAAAAEKDKTTATLKVDCRKGESINSALSQHAGARSLVVEISGLCRENVLVTRDRVTLRGADPTADGVDAEDDAEIAHAAVWVRGAQLVELENLKLTCGFTGLLATGVSLTSLRVTNCRLEGNSAYGMQLQTALVEVSDSVFSANGNNNAGVFGGSRFQCSNCTLADPQGSGPLGTIRNNVLAFAASRVLFDHCVLTNGGNQIDDSLALISDSSIEGVAPNGGSLNATGASSIVLTRVQVKGSMGFSQATSGQLLGVTQTTGAPPNFITDNSFVRIADASPATGGPPSIPSVVRGFQLSNFSKASLFQTSTVSGSLNCSSGADAFCQTPANVSGISNCGLCPKP